jgi:amidophosphoribosyltransferase
MSYLVEEFRRFYNPKNIHIRIPSPPVVAPCFYGINMSTTEELLATKYIKNLQNPTLKELEKMSLEL